ncbi:sodium- and chloride-dependent glycine transporter 1-like isoform X4 [Sitophilus oryzae]|uniref:Transporter n=1 Tax=Sitophilus oryzae TaxID=7048 RepID=A0A6J2YXE0_SITOR|nr:sodium- and chloride-dependent glycine transporter 1-like isoform X4 [Sitophilus oryzae]
MTNKSNDVTTNWQYNGSDAGEDAGECRREKWANKTEFVLSSLGYAIGIGNVWRFPYLCYRSGGGAFLVPYLIMLFFCGIPLYFLETSLGQFSSSGCITVFKIAPLFKGAGIAMIVINIIVTTYFVTLYAYPLLFLYYCFQSTLPWSRCDNSWNTPSCIQLDLTQHMLGNQTKMDLSNLVGVKTSADEFFNREILRISDNIDEINEIVWPLFTCNTLAWIATYLCMSNGVKSIGKAVYFTATFPFLILFVLLVRGLTLPGAMKGIYFYIYPQWDQLTNFKIWCDAAVQLFFSLGPGWGGIINMASYNNFHNNNKLDSIIIPICNSGTSIVAGFVVFSVLGYMSHKTGIPVSSVATGGPGLAFVTYPEAISLLPWSNLWAVLFFLMIFFLGLSSVFVSTEAVITSITDEFPILRKYKLFIGFFLCIAMWAGSTLFTTDSGIYWLSLLDWYSASVTIILISIVEVIVIGWTYGVTNFVSDIEFMVKEKVSWFWIVSWKVTTPLILIAMFIITISYNTRISYNGKEYPDWVVSIGWTSCFASMAWIPICMGYHLLYKEDGDLIERIGESITPSLEWGPADERIRVHWLKNVVFKRAETSLVEIDPIHQQFIELTTTV